MELKKERSLSSFVVNNVILGISHPLVKVYFREHLLD